MTLGRLIAGLIAVLLVGGCVSQPPVITSAGTLRVEIDPNAPSTTTIPPTPVSPTSVTRPPAADPVPTTTVVPPTTAPPTTPQERIQLLCDAFLLSQGNVFESVYHQAMSDVRSALRPGATNEVRRALDTLIAEDRLPTDRRNNLTGILQEEVVGQCRSRYYRGVEPFDGDVVARFFNMVVAGRRAPATEIAPAHVIARFEPWEPWPSTELISPGIRIREDASFIMALSETVEAHCTFLDGTIRSCFLSRSD